MTHPILTHLKEGGELKATFQNEKDNNLYASYGCGSGWSLDKTNLILVEGFQPGDIIRDGDVELIKQYLIDTGEWKERIDIANFEMWYWMEEHQRFILRRVPKVEESLTENGRSLGHDNGIFPCPLCGGTEADHIVMLGKVAPDHYRITCTSCHLRMERDRKDKVISNWNHRASTTQEVGADGWVKCSDRLPESDTNYTENVLVYNGGVHVAYCYVPSGKWTAPFMGDVAIVTHWRPLPAPPTV